MLSVGQDMELQETTTTDYRDMCLKYNWFANTYPSAIQKASDEFFLEGFNFGLLGICKNINTLSDKCPYFVTKIQLDKMYDVQFRLSEKSVSILLDRALGKSETRFNLNRLTDLEAKVITSFNDFIYNSIKNFIKPVPPTIKRLNFDVIHLVFLIKDIEKGLVGKFIVTLPEALLEPSIVQVGADKFGVDDFADATVDVSVKVGSTRFKLIDIKNIEIGDIVVFDNSELKHMVLHFGDYVKDINLNPNLGLVTPVDNNEGEDDMADNTNLWDSIEVEMDAQFDRVKITLGELKKIEEGMVVDIASIYNNKVTLSVEDKPIAKGELVIINDRYGVKVDEVYAGAPQNVTNDNQVFEEIQEQTAEEEPIADNVQETVQEEAASEDDEFDYSDFELEDEDI